MCLGRWGHWTALVSVVCECQWLESIPASAPGLVARSCLASTTVCNYHNSSVLVLTTLWGVLFNPAQHTCGCLFAGHDSLLLWLNACGVEINLWLGLVLLDFRVSRNCAWKLLRCLFPFGAGRTWHVMHPNSKRFCGMVLIRSEYVFSWRERRGKVSNDEPCPGTKTIVFCTLLAWI
jgi:hypothetical protein